MPMPRFNFDISNQHGELMAYWTEEGAAMSDFTGIGRNEIGMTPRRERDRVRRQSLRPPSDTVQTVYIYPVDEDGTDIEYQLEPFHIRRGARMHEFRVQPDGLVCAPVDQLIAGITEAQTRILTPTQYWELRRALIMDQRGEETCPCGCGQLVPQGQSGLYRRISFVNGRITPRNGQGQSMELRDNSLTMEFEGEGISPEAVQMLTGHTAEVDASCLEEKIKTEDELRTLDDGTTEYWCKGKLEAFTVDGVYYARHAKDGQEGHSTPGHVQQLFSFKDVSDGYGKFIYDQDGYINSEQAEWDSPFCWQNKGQPMRAMSELTEKDFVSDEYMESVGW